MGSSPDILRVRDLRVWFPVKKGVFARTVGWVKAVDGVSFDVRRGETLAIVGESGSGKSTIARTVCGLVKQTGGSFELGGRVAMVFQDPLGSLNPRLTIRATLEEIVKASPVSRLPSPAHPSVSRLASPDRPFDLPPPARDPAGLLALVGLDAAALDKYPHEFSGGQRQRICIARSLAAAPELLICDEAVSALDLSVRATVLELLEDLKARLSLSLLFITHDLGVVQHIADRVVVMHRGRVVEAGTCDDVLLSPREAYTRTLIASVPRICA